MHAIATAIPNPPASRPGEGRTGARIICDALKANGVHTVFGYSGGAILHFYDALHRDPDLYHVMVRHEQAAAHAAAGYARATGRPGVCVATSGPGATNLLTGIMDGHMDSTPMVILCGQVDSRLIGKDAFQETDVMSITASVTKHGFQPRHVDEVEGILHAAFHIAATGRPGPVFIDLPKDVLMAITERRSPRPLPLPGYRNRIDPDPAAIAAAADLLRGAERPLLLLGGGALIADAGAPLLALAERLDLPVVSTINAKGVIPESHPSSHGMIGMYGRKSGVWALMNTDLLLAFGCRFTDRITGDAARFAAGKKIVHVDVDAYELGKNVPVALAIQADAAKTAQALLRPPPGIRPASRGGAGRGRPAPRARCAFAAFPIRLAVASIPSWSWTSSTACAARTTSSPPASGSTRCSPAIFSSTIGRAPSSAPAERAPWDTGCRPPSARPSGGRTPRCS